jgi:hypothetical protein
MPDALTWSALLARWTEFAAASVALPDDGEGGRWKRAVPHVVALQALTHALGEVGELEPGEIPAALDRAAVGVREAARALERIWEEDGPPPEAREVSADAELALALAETTGLAWTVASARLVAGHPADVAAAVAASGIAGTLLVPAPGQPLFPTSVAAHFRPAVWDEERLGAVAAAIEAFLDRDGDAAFEGFWPQMQVYRQFDFARGGPVRDLVVPTMLGVVAGQPLLVPAVDGGAAMPVALPPRRTKEIEPVPVEFIASDDDLG